MKPLTSLRAHAGSTRSSCIPGLATAAKAASYRCDLTSFPALELPGSARFQIGLGRHIAHANTSAVVSSVTSSVRSIATISRGPPTIVGVTQLMTLTGPVKK
jgi:hypothetical protein